MIGGYLNQCQQMMTDIYHNQLKITHQEKKEIE